MNYSSGSYQQRFHFFCLTAKRSPNFYIYREKQFEKKNHETFYKENVVSMDKVFREHILIFCYICRETGIHECLWFLFALVVRALTCRNGPSTRVS